MAWINARNLEGALVGDKKVPAEVTDEQRINKEVSMVVGKKVYNSDPKLIKWIVEKKKNADPDDLLRLLQVPANINELRELFK